MIGLHGYVVRYQTGPDIHRNHHKPVYKFSSYHIPFGDQVRKQGGAKNTKPCIDNGPGCRYQEGVPEIRLFKYSLIYGEGKTFRQQIYALGSQRRIGQRINNQIIKRIDAQDDEQRYQTINNNLQNTFRERDFNLILTHGKFTLLIRWILP